MNKGESSHHSAQDIRGKHGQVELDGIPGPGEGKQHVVRGGRGAGRHKLVPAASYDGACSVCQLRILRRSGVRRQDEQVSSCSAGLGLPGNQ